MSPFAQALEAIKLLKTSDAIKIRRAEMRVKVTAPGKAMIHSGFTHKPLKHFYDFE